MFLPHGPYAVLRLLVCQAVFEPPSQGCHEVVEVPELWCVAVVQGNKLRSLLGWGDSPDSGFLTGELLPYVGEDLSQGEAQLLGVPIKSHAQRDPLWFLPWGSPSRGLGAFPP